MSESNSIVLEAGSPIVPATEEQEAYYDMGNHKYPMSLLIEAVKEYNETAPHPEPRGALEEHISHIVEKVWFDDEGLMHTRISFPDTTVGHIVKSIFEVHQNFHTTLACSGTVKDNTIITADNLSVRIELEV